jgi:hypothetical protein
VFLPEARSQAELIEVIQLDQRSDSDSGELVAIWSADQALSALGLIADLPAGEVSRCFFPGWAIRAHSDSSFLFSIAFCFECDGALLKGPTVPVDEQTIHGFEPDSHAARELLLRFRACVQG